MSANADTDGVFHQQSCIEESLSDFAAVSVQYDHWRDLYTDLAASPPVERSSGSG